LKPQEQVLTVHLTSLNAYQPITVWAGQTMLSPYKDNEMAGECGMHGRDEKYLYSSNQKSEGKRSLIRPKRR
jgi:hypothetical protein